MSLMSLNPFVNNQPPPSQQPPPHFHNDNLNPPFGFNASPLLSQNMVPTANFPAGSAQSSIGRNSTEMYHRGDFKTNFYQDLSKPPPALSMTNQQIGHTPPQPQSLMTQNVQPNSKLQLPAVPDTSTDIAYYNLPAGLMLPLVKVTLIASFFFELSIV
jgi:hypothetical protein